MPKTVEEVAEHLIDVCTASFGGSRSNRRFSVTRQEVRHFYDAARIEGTILERIDEEMREQGFVLIPVDRRDFSKAGQFVISKSSVFQNCRDYNEYEEE